MGVLDWLKGAYLRAEDRYYRILDRIDKRIPIYKIVDPIDRVVPSFALLLVAIGILAALGIYMLIGGVLPFAGTNFILVVTDEDGAAISDATVMFSYAGAAPQQKTTDSFGEAGIAVPLGITLTASAEHPDFEPGTMDFEVSVAGVQRETITLSLPVELTRTIRLLDSLGQPILGDVHLSFRCQNVYATPPAEMTVTNGIATVEMPSNCEKLFVSITSDSYESVDSIEVDLTDKAIYLSESAVGDATITVNVRDSDGNPIDGISVELYKYTELAANPNVGPIDFATTYFGQVTFTKAPDTYVLKTYDITGKYSQEVSTPITAESGQTKTYDFTLQENVIGNVNIKVIDKATKAALGNAKVTLRYASSNDTIAELTTGSDGTVSFPVTRDVEYRATVEKTDYVLAKQANLRYGTAAHTIEMEKCSALTCGMLVVQVVDQDGKAIPNATVALYSGATDFLAGYSAQASDINGIAKFRGVSSGSYWAYAFKQGNEGRSDVGYFSSAASDMEVDLTVTMQIANGTVRVTVIDTYGSPVERPVVSMYDALDNKLVGSDYADFNGVFSREIKADKKVYVVVAKEGMAAYTTASKPVIASTVQNFRVVLEPKITDRDVEIRFKGLYKEGLLAITLAAGEEYTARWQVRIPEEKSYSEAGAHLRTGDATIVERDSLYIKSVNAPGTSEIKAASYDETSGFDEQQYAVTNADAKWANIRWNEPKAGIYEIEAEVKVRETAAVGDELSIYYRAWALNSERERDPTDQLIESFELYDNAHKQLYEVGVTTLCTEEFCFSATIKDLKEGLLESITSTYMARIYNEYELQFTLTNNSETRVHNNANLRIKNLDKALLFGSYTLYDADGKPTTGTLNDYEFPNFSAGNMKPANKVMGKLKFVTQKAISALLDFRLVSDMQPVFDKSIAIDILAPYELDVFVSPGTYPSGIEYDINVFVKAKGTGLEIESADVRLKDRHENVIATARTDKAGYAFLTLPAQKPGETLILVVEKPNYNRKEIKLEISKEIFQITPEKLGVALNAKVKTESEDRLSVKNVTTFPLKITEVKLTGEFKNLLDTKRIGDWLDSAYTNYTLNPNGRIELLLKTYLSEEGLNIESPENIEARLIIEAGNYGQKWYFEVPVKISIGLGSEVDNPACLVLTRNSWESSTEGTPIMVEFSIVNNCTINGTPVALRDISVKADWKGNEIGEFALAVQDAETPLRSGYFKKILGRLGQDASEPAVLKYTPFGGMHGLADAEIVVQATNPMGDRDQLLTASIKAKIMSVNMKDCIRFDKVRLTMDEEGRPEPNLKMQLAGKNLDAFTINTKGCGGNVEFEVKSELRVSNDKFTIADGESAQVEVYAQDAAPGQYGVFVHAKGPSEVQPRLIRNIRARVNAIGCIQPSRYEFDVYDDLDDQYDGYDTVELVNNCYDEVVTFGVDITNIRGAVLSGLKNMALGMGGALLFGVSQFFRGGTPSSGGDDTGLAPQQKQKQQQGQPPADTDKKTEEERQQQKSRKPIPPGNTAGGNTAGEYNPLSGAPTGFVSLGGEALPPTALFNWAGFGTYVGAGGLVGLVLGIATYMLDDHTLSVAQVERDVGLGNRYLITALVAIVNGQPVTDPAQLVDTEIGMDQRSLVIDSRQGVALLHTENIGLIFTNLTGFTTEPDEPRYKYLYVGAIRRDYDVTHVYKLCDFWSWACGKRTGTFEMGGQKFMEGEVDLDETEFSPAPYSKEFRLEFNSKAPDINAIPPQPARIDCQAGTRTGSTGAGARPRIELAWDWSAIDEDGCDVGNNDYIYCDATQFSIEVLKKVEAIRTFLSANAPFSCPSPLDVAPTTSVIGSYDIGISKLAVNKSGNDVEIEVDVTNTNPGTIKTDVAISITRGSNNQVINCPNGTQRVDVLSKETVKCKFSGLATDNYSVLATIDPIIDCESCEDKTASNQLTTTFTIGQTGLVECEPYSASRLGEFLAASGISGANVDAVLNDISFRTHLIRDRYSSDFQRDFDDYSMLQSFFNAPTYYTDTADGLGIYFRNPQLFEFRPMYAEANPEGYLLPGAGTYNVLIDITFEDDTWGFFKADGTPNATIEVKLEKAESAVPPSPFYDLPFNGPIGESSGRIGYGLDYSGSRVLINSSGGLPVYTVEIPGSTPVPKGNLEVEKTEDVRWMNVTSRGSVLVVSTAGSNPTMKYGPSYATPAIMRITNNNDEAWAFYSVGIDGAAISTGPSMARWLGLGINCKGFSDRPVVDEYRYTADQHALANRCALIPADVAPTTYGFEFCDPVQFGNMFLESIFYTPQGKSGIISRTVGNDDMELIGEAIAGSSVPLNGVSGMLYNQYGASGIQNVDNVLELVESGLVCVTTTDITADFWWNPKPALDALDAQEQAAVAQCISRT